jgi:hypothetical protein
LPGLDLVSRSSMVAPFGTPFTLHTVGIVVIAPEIHERLPESWFCRSWFCSRGLGFVGLGVVIGGLGFVGLRFVVGVLVL